MIRDQFWLTARSLLKIEPHLPTDTRGKARVDDRRVISGIVHVLKSGSRWVDAPPDGLSLRLFGSLGGPELGPNP
jgi:transposase